MEGVVLESEIADKEVSGSGEDVVGGDGSDVLGGNRMYLSRSKEGKNFYAIS